MRDELLTADKSLLGKCGAAGCLWQGVVGENTLTYVPAGFLVFEKTLENKVVQGVRLGFYHCHAIAKSALATIVHVSKAGGQKVPPAVAQLEQVLAIMERKLTGAGGSA